MKTKKTTRTRQTQSPAITCDKTTAPAPTAVEIPAWVNSTHPEHSYSLVIFESNDLGVESINLTRGEYILLKAHLAGMRGYKVRHLIEKRACAAELGKSLPEDYRQNDAQQHARHLQNARAIYRSCPDLVVFESEKLDKSLEQLAE